MSKQKLYHLSFDLSLPRTLKPRQPYGTENSKELIEKLPPRVSFSPTVLECWYALYPNLGFLFHDKRYGYPWIDIYVYQTEIDEDTKIVSEEDMKREVWDYGITREVAVLEPVKVTLMAKIRIYNRSDKPKFKEVKYRPFNDPEKDEVIVSSPIEIKLLKKFKRSYVLV